MTEAQRPAVPKREMPSPYDPEILESVRAVLNDSNHEAWLQIEANAIAVDECCKNVAEHARHVA